MYHRMFQQGDLVKYTGEKLSKELGSKIGTVCARVGKTETGVVVDFGDDAYVIDERNLARTVAKAKTEEPEVEKKKQPEVQKRKGVGKRQKNAENAE